MKKIACFFLLLCVCAFDVQAQLPTGTILGVVTDSTGAFIAGATLTARDIETGQTRNVTSGADGSYRFSALAVGKYEVTAEKSGFQKSIRSGLTLDVAQEGVVNFTLAVGGLSQQVVVSSEAPLVNTTTSSLGGLVDDKRVSELPLNGRNYIDLTLLQPGITQHRNMAASPSSAGLWYSSNGAPVHSNNYLLDGAYTGNLQGVNSASAAGNTLGVDGIREYRVITNSFSAEYGMTMGSQVLVVSKSGANKWSGDVFEYLRNSALDARNYFDAPPSIIGRRLPQFQRNDFGASLGGPITKDKTFFYAVYEGVRQHQGLSIIDNVIAAGCHGPAGAVVWNGQGSQPTVPFIGPCTQLGANPSGPNTNTVTIAAPIAPLLLNLYPSPNLPNNQFTYPFTAPTRDDYGQIRVDHNFSSNDSAFVRYTVDDATVHTAVIANTGPFSYPGFTMDPRSRNQYLTLSESHIFSPALLNTARFSYSRTTPAINSGSSYVGPQYSFVPANGTSELGSINIGGVSALGPFATAPSYLPQNVFTWSDDVFYTRGRHSFKFGALINRFQQFDYSDRNARGTVTFANVSAFLSGTPQVETALTPGSILGRNYRFSTIGFYAQDDMRVTQRLTVNLGLRYEFMTQFHEKDGFQSAIRNVATDAAPTVGIPFKNPTLHNFSPRVGFAWDLFGDGKTALRGGFALLYDLTPYGTAIDVVQTNAKPFASTSTVAGFAPGGFAVPFKFAGVTPDVALFDYNLHQQHLLSYNLTLERQLPFATALSVAYAGSKGIDIFGRRDRNPTVPQGVPGAGGVCVARPAGQAVNLTNMVDGAATACWLGTDPYINPHWGSILLQTGAASSYYNALQVLLTKRVTRGLQFQSSYTYANMMDEPQSEAPNEANSAPVYPVDSFHDSLDRSLSTYDLRNNWRFNTTYQFPQLSSKDGVLPKLVNGWETSAIISLQGGYPFTVNLQTNRSRDKAFSSAPGLDRPDIAPGRTIYSMTHGVSTPNGIDPCPTAGQRLGTPQLWFDPCAFTIPKAGFLGNAGRNILRGPGLSDVDFSLIKNTAIKQLGEAGNLEFRAEFFNFFNHPNFAMPGDRNAYAGTADVQAPLPDSGVISTTGNATSRQIQLALKVIF